MKQVISVRDLEEMLKNGKEYALEIVVREKDWTILHFLFK